MSFDPTIKHENLFDSNNGLLPTSVGNPAADQILPIMRMNLEYHSKICKLTILEYELFCEKKEKDHKSKITNLKEQKATVENEFKAKINELAIQTEKQIAIENEKKIAELEKQHERDSTKIGKIRRNNGCKIQ
ncbi:hypothetical protein CANARDRAFT_5645 [[Candida] arabinofermentans NRRL YB-2248]|uniref:Uncharacterized protein n=1 Tax=[Candida] arabinofermentans NRRL YB-2248 TaxID=983967 RepID=A0A1E4T5Y3_9ASCO|nr:hypothetical protein CANARDRAFT_5645 [[Candida] arabinofermentans NRRL YB-2248]